MKEWPKFKRTNKFVEVFSASNMKHDINLEWANMCKQTKIFEFELMQLNKNGGGCTNKVWKDRVGKNKKLTSGGDVYLVLKGMSIHTCIHFFLLN